MVRYAFNNLGLRGLKLEANFALNLEQNKINYTGIVYCIRENITIKSIEIIDCTVRLIKNKIITIWIQTENVSTIFKE